MTDYRRFYIPGSTWFFTVVLARRNGNRLLVERIEDLRAAFRAVKQRRPFDLDAVVILPEHLHCIWTLPPDDSDYSTRWSLLKGHFSRHVPTGEAVCSSRAKRRERGIWQRRFWAHCLFDQDDYNTHVDYIHWNPVKHGLVRRAADWPHSSFRRFVAAGVYPADWGHSGIFAIEDGEWLE
jgi:putative transposase